MITEMLITVIAKKHYDFPIVQAAADYFRLDSCDCVNYNIKMNNKELEFVVFCIENTAEHLGIKGDEAYKLLTEKSDILDNYIIPCFDALHTQGKEYIVNDIADVLSEKGLTI